MAVLTPTEIAAYAYDAGFRGDTLVTAVAIALGESGGDTAAVGDTTLVTDKWGPSIGLWQVRSLNAQRGTGQDRDASRLTEPRFNAHAAYSISGKGSTFQPWTVYKTGAYRRYLDEAADGAAEVDRMVDVDEARGDGGGGIVDGIRGAIDAASPLDEAVGVLRFVGDPRSWVRIGMGAAGVLLVLVGVILLAREATGPLGGAAKRALSLVPHPAAQAGAAAADVVGD